MTQQGTNKPMAAPANPAGAAVVRSDLELWLSEQLASEPETSIFWAPCHWTCPADWGAVRGVEHLAVLISTAVRADSNVCFVSATRSRTGRYASAIGLISRKPLGWAVIIDDAHQAASRTADVRRIGYRYDNYDSFSALSASEICWAWVITGCLPDGLTYRPRSP